MVKIDKDIWFRAKTYGWGWGLPLKWQGWFVYLIYFFIIFFPLFIPELRQRFDKNEPEAFLYLLYVLFPTLVLIAICYKKGEKPRWRWGR